MNKSCETCKLELTCEYDEYCMMDNYKFWEPKPQSRSAATPEPMPDQQRGKILLKALDIINGERQDTYGKPEDSFKLIGEYWSNYLSANGKGVKVKVSPRDVAEMMMLFKIARMSGQKPNLDNYLDLVGYAGIAADMLEVE